MQEQSQPNYAEQKAAKKLNQVLKYLKGKGGAELSLMHPEVFAYYYSLLSDTKQKSMFMEQAAAISPLLISKIDYKEKFEIHNGTGSSVHSARVFLTNTLFLTQNKQEKPLFQLSNVYQYKGVGAVSLRTALTINQIQDKSKFVQVQHRFFEAVFQKTTKISDISEICLRDFDFRAMNYKYSFSEEQIEKFVQQWKENGKKTLSIDCEMVQCGEVMSVAQVAVVDFYSGDIILQEYCVPDTPITDFKTQFSGVTAENLVNQQSFNQLKCKLELLFENTIIIGHGLDNDFQYLQMEYPLVIDTAALFQIGERKQKLSFLIQHYYNETIQSGSHAPAEDALASLVLVKSYLQFYGFQIECKKLKYGLSSEKESFDVFFKKRLQAAPITNISGYTFNYSLQSENLKLVQDLSEITVQQTERIFVVTNLDSITLENAQTELAQLNLVSLVIVQNETDGKTYATVI